MRGRERERFGKYAHKTQVELTNYEREREGGGGWMGVEGENRGRERGEKGGGGDKKERKKTIHTKSNTCTRH